jgi:iron complex outermembrane receptor protein
LQRVRRDADADARSIFDSKQRQTGGNIMLKNLRQYCIGLIFVWTVLPAVAPAQSPVGQQASEGLAEIVVTAQKREQNLQNVPIAVTAVSSDDLENAGIQNLLGIGSLVPSLNVTDSNGRLSMSLRGIGTVVGGPGVESPIALYVDGVYYSSTLASLLSFNNVSQIEVLKGPQGTLFGRNATGGLVQITTDSPSQALAAKADLSYGNYQTVTGRAYVGGGVTSDLVADVALYAKHQNEGWGTNLFNGAQAYNVDHDESIRSKWIYTPGDLTKLTFIADYSNTLDTLGAYGVIPGSRNPFSPVPAFDSGWNVDITPLPSHRVEAEGASIRWDQNIGELKLASITAYRADQVGTFSDFDGTPIAYESLYLYQRDNQFSQELSLSSVSSGRLQWSTGLYYFHSNSDTAPTSIALNDAGIRITFHGHQKADSEALFGQATYELFDATNLTLGGRYTTEKRSALGVSELLQPNGAPPDAAININVPDKAVTFNKFTYRVSLDHRFSQETMAYVSANTGFKSGGYNVDSPLSPAFMPETLDTYEVGVKNDLFDRRVRLNVAGFHNSYKNIQVSRVSGDVYQTENGGTARTYGSDFDAEVLLTPDWHVSLGGLFESAIFTNYAGCPTGAPGGGVPRFFSNCTGKELPLATKRTFNVASEYTLHVGSGSLAAHAGAYVNSGFYTEPDNVIHQSGFVQFDASLRYNFARHGLYVQGYGRNLSNRRIITFGGTEPTGVQNVLYAEPRTYGILFGAALP